MSELTNESTMIAAICTHPIATQQIDGRREDDIKSERAHKALTRNNGSRDRNDRA